jgi:SAM-dependent methyltransferase
MRCETLDVLASGRLLSPSAERTKAPIATVLKEALPEHGLVLEIGSGTGQHIVHFAKEMPYLRWQPSERDEDCLRSIRAWQSFEAADNLHEPIFLDVGDQPWPLTSASAVVSLNMIHIAPWTAAEALIGGARTVLQPGGLLFLYGPFRCAGQHTAPGNEAFDRQLRSTNPEWGVRDLDDVAALASRHDFAAPDVHEMPANNLSIIFRRR